MGVWSEDVLARIAGKDDLHIAPYREDGVTCGTPTWIWSVRLGRELFVRAYNGPDSRWYQAAVREQAGRITADGETFDVAFAPAEDALGESVDAAYRRKYEGSPYLAAMIGRRARSATVQVSPA